MEVKPLGPVQLHPGPVDVVVKPKVVPEQIGVVPNAAGVAGVGFIVTTVVAGVPGHPAIVIATVYVPEFAAVAPWLRRADLPEARCG